MSQKAVFPLLLLLLIGIGGCGSPTPAVPPDSPIVEPPEPPLPPEVKPAWWPVVETEPPCDPLEGVVLEYPPLAGTRWKLVGVFDAQGALQKEFEPTDCAYCYTLTFHSDSTGTGKSGWLNSNDMQVHLSNICYLLYSESYFLQDGDVSLFCDMVTFITSYSFEENELKFYYNRDYYFLYRPIEE